MKRYTTFDDRIETIGLFTWFLWLPLYMIGWLVTRIFRRLTGKKADAPYNK